MEDEIKLDLRTKEARALKQKSTFKKGNTSWQPASVLDVIDKQEGYRYRWSNKDATNLAKKAAEGWETVSSGTSGDGATHVPSGQMNDGKALTTTMERKDCILQRIPEELALERDAWHNAENQRRVTGLTAHVKDKVTKGGAPAHGSITISSLRGGETVID